MEFVCCWNTSSNTVALSLKIVTSIPSSDLFVVGVTAENK